MYATSFEYYRAGSVAEAVELLRANPGAKLLAGGHSLLPQMKLRVSTPTALIDIGRIEGLRGISLDGDTLVIGAMTTHDTLANSALVKEHCPIVAEAAAQIGDQQVRNRGTIGGSLAHADPAADLPTVFSALGGALSVVGANGERSIGSAECFTDLFTTSLHADEVITAVRLPAYGAGTGGAYFKHSHPASGYAVVGAAALLTISDGTCTAARIAVGGATANPVRATLAEEALVGKAPDPATLAEAANLVREAIVTPLSDYYASGDYRRHLASVLAHRALLSAAQRAG